MSTKDSDITVRVVSSGWPAAKVLVVLLAFVIACAGAYDALQGDPSDGGVWILFAIFLVLFVGVWRS